MMREHRLQPSASGLLVALLLLLVAACDLIPGRVEESDVIGTWSSDMGGTINLAKDGSFGADGLKNDYFDNYQRAGDPRSGSGTWSLLDSDSCLLLTFDKLSRSEGKGQYGMRCIGSGSSIKLYFIIGDPDDHNFYYFTKGS
jgi:hypothetical protein